MKETKAVKDYTNKLLMLANKIRMLGEEFSDTRVVEKILVTLLERFESKISSLAESRDLSIITLRAYRKEEIIEETFQVKEVDQAQGGNKGKKQWSKKNNKKGENSNSGGNQGKHPPCPYCHANSWGIWKGSSDDWLIDNGCTNHMSFDESLFNIVNKSEVSRVRIGNGQYIEVKGKETVAIKGSRMGHFHYSALDYMQKNDLVRGMTYNRGAATVCGVCQLGKQARLSFPVNKVWRAVEKLQLIHTNVCGPMRTASLSGNRVKVISSDNGTEYTTDKFVKFCEAAGIEHQLTATYSPQQNEVGEKRNRTIMEIVTNQGFKGKTHFQAWYDARKEKLDQKAEYGVFVGYSNLTKATRWNWDKVEPEQAYTEEKNQNSMEEEIKMTHKNQTWELVDKPLHKKAIGVKWVYRTKLNADGSVNKYMVRLVIKGYAQLFGVDFSETFAPVARLDTIRLLIAFATPKQWRIYQLNVKINTELVKQFKAQLMQAFEMTNLGEMTFFLGLEIQQSQQGIFIGQQKYAKEVLKKFNMEDCKSLCTLLDPNEKFSKDDDAEKADEGLYRSIIGCLIYLTATRPDIMCLAGSCDDMRSTSGYMFSLGSGCFCWSSKKHEIIAQSTAEAEYVAAAVVINQALWLRRLMTDLKMVQDVATRIFKAKHFKISIILLEKSRRMMK
ncbi:hypothetical protein AAG906_022015 [Vitis piasezkii]